MDPASPSTWVPTEETPEGMAVRAIVFVLIMVLAFLLAVAARGALRGWARGIGPATRRALGAPDTSATWARGEWACGRCRSLNRGRSTACERCRAPRADAEIHVAPETAPDIIPAEIPAGPTAVVTLEHNPAAHGQGLTGHWRLRVNTVIVGSAARRDGAVALLRGDRRERRHVRPRGRRLRPIPAAGPDPRLRGAAPAAARTVPGGRRYSSLTASGPSGTSIRTRPPSMTTG